MVYERYRSVIALVLAGLIATGCGGGGRVRLGDVLRLTPESLQTRALQTRTYDGVSEFKLYSAATGVIQDLGFIIDESEPELGLIVGSKWRDADPDLAQRVKQVFGTAALWLAYGLGGESGPVFMPVDDYQKLWASIVIRPTSENADETSEVRVTFQRIVWNTEDEVDRFQSLDEPEFYQRFFDLLSKSVFLEGQKE